MTVASHDNPLTGPSPDGQADGPELKRCAQCGRVGVRGFKTLKPGDFGGPPLTLCSNKNACRKRWPKQPVEEQ